MSSRSSPRSTTPGSRSAIRSPSVRSWSRRRATSRASGRAPTATRGVHKAPANEVVRGAHGLGFQVTQGEQDRLNPDGHQLHPLLPGPRHPRLGRPHALERSRVALHQRSPALQLRRGVDHARHPVGGLRAQRRAPVAAGQVATSTFLTRVWRDGALFGATPDQAFYVKCDAETNPPEVVDAGQLIVEIGIAPVKPAEFVVFRISQFNRRRSRPSWRRHDQRGARRCPTRNPRRNCYFRLCLGGAEAAGSSKSAPA